MRPIRAAGLECTSAWVIGAGQTLGSLVLGLRKQRGPQGGFRRHRRGSGLAIGLPKGPHELHLSFSDVPVGGEDEDRKKFPTAGQRRVGKQFLKTAEVGVASRQPLRRSTAP